MIRLGYSLLSILLTPAIRHWLRRRTRRGKEDATRIGERFGHASAPRPGGKLVWLHAASVGETQSVLTLVRALLAQHPALHLLITTGTVTSAALVAQAKLPRVTHQFVPVDTYPAVRRFLTHWKPDLALWVESEFWPQLLWQARDRGTKLLLINARMSPASARGWKRWPRTATSLLHGFSGIYAGSRDDAARLTALGAPNVQDCGNLKYDAQPLAIDNALLSELNQQCLGRSPWVAASTHANEEQLVADVHTHVAQQFPGLLCILIPRHATRGDAIAEDLRQRGMRLAQRSKNEPITPDTQIYLADTMGELGSFYRLSEIVFIGGSLVAVGGHNPIEPARLGAALLTGPHIHNFAEIMDRLARDGALNIVHDKTALREQLAALLADETLRLSMAERGIASVNDMRGASEQILAHVASLLAEPSHAHA